jgi:hypothetical protein
MFVLSIHHNSSAAKESADACSRPSRRHFSLFVSSVLSALGHVHTGFLAKARGNPPDLALKKHGLRRVSFVIAATILFKLFASLARYNIFLYFTKSATF